VEQNIFSSTWSVLYVFINLLVESIILLDDLNNDNMKVEKRISGIVYDPIKREKIPGVLYISNGKINRFDIDKRIKGPIILPGFVDSHIHIESSMLTPSEFSKIAKKHGTVAVVADPHEIANVAGIEGIDFMINNSKKAEVKFFFGAPSCVPASPFDCCLEILDNQKIQKLLKRDDIYFLGEMMNFPGVINDVEDVIKKISAAKELNKPIDGHAPGLGKEALKKYINSGISTDHECFTIEEAYEKISLGMKVLIREGSAAKNFNSLHKLIEKYPKMTMLCTDDCHPDDLIKGHINTQVRRSLEFGYDIFDILQVVSVNPIKHYNLNVGLLQEGDSADFIVVDNLKNLNILENYINGEEVIKEKRKARIITDNLNYRFTSQISIESVRLLPHGEKVKAIKIIEGELVTEIEEYQFKEKENNVVADVKNDFLKIVVVNRYKEGEIFVGFINGFGIKTGAIAESIAHDSHHIIAVGVDDESILNAINFVIKNRGGLCYCNGSLINGLPLPVYGIMGNVSAEEIAKKYKEINSTVIEAGSIIRAPFMTLSFMALSVIPKLKITPKGLFDVNKFDYIDQFC